MTTIELDVESNSTPLMRRSTAGYEFDENDDEWMLDGSISIKLGIFSELGVEQKTLAGFRKSLSRYAQELSAHHCKNIAERAQHFFRVTVSRDFSAEALSLYRVNLDDEHMWYLGMLRGFLDSWKEWGFPGITRKAIDYLDGLTIKGTLAQMNLIKSCLINQVHEDEWEISLYGAERLYQDDCVVRLFGNFLMTDDFSDTQWFMSVEDAIDHLVKLGIEPHIELQPLWPAELARLRGIDCSPK